MKDPQFNVGKDEDGGTELDEAEKQGEAVSVSSLRVIMPTDVTQRNRLRCCEKKRWHTRLFVTHCVPHRRPMMPPRPSLKRCVMFLGVVALI